LLASRPEIGGSGWTGKVGGKIGGKTGGKADGRSRAGRQALISKKRRPLIPKNERVETPWLRPFFTC
jgi:hypothetical protein